MQGQSLEQYKIQVHNDYNYYVTNTKLNNLVSAISE
jgi:hypothetical protein